MAISLGLERIKALLEKLGNPQLDYPVIHVAGTNGKGSTVQLISMMLRNAAPSLKVGQFNSPHFLYPRDSIRIIGKALSEEEDRELKINVTKHAEGLETPPSPFEIRTAMAFLAFKLHKVDIAVVEVGMGGLLDATNVFGQNKLLCVITAIDYDHQAFLGETIEEIASHKAGIIQDAESLVVVGKQKYFNAVKNNVLIRVSKDNVLFIDENLSGTLSPVIDNFANASFKDNLLTAVTALNFLSRKMSKFYQTIYPKIFTISSMSLEQIQEVVETFRWPGRMEFLMKEKGIWLTSSEKTNILIDGAHNPAGILQLSKSVKEGYGESQITWVIALSSNRNPQDLLSVLKIGNHDVIYIVPFSYVEEMHWVTCWDPLRLAEKVKEVLPDNLVLVKGSLQQAWSLIEDDKLYVVTGSLYLMADVYRLLNIPNEFI